VSIGGWLRSSHPLKSREALKLPIETLPDRYLVGGY
jgi:hypothetical protein